MRITQFLAKAAVRSVWQLGHIRHAGQIAALFAVALPMLLAILAFTWLISSLYGAQARVNMIARSVTLAAISSVNRGSATDAGVTTAVTQTVLSNGYTPLIVQGNGPPPTTSNSSVAVQGQYGSSSTGIAAWLGNGTVPGGTDTITVSLTTTVQITWWTLGAPTYTIHAQAVAHNTQGRVIASML